MILRKIYNHPPGRTIAGKIHDVKHYFKIRIKIMDKCLTCYRLLRYTSDMDFRGKKFYGDWNYCICPFNLGRSIFKHRRRTMTFFTVTTRIILQEHDEVNKTAEIQHIGSFAVEAENFDEATQKAKELMPDEYFQIIGVEEILT